MTVLRIVASVIHKYQLQKELQWKRKRITVGGGGGLFKRYTCFGCFNMSFTSAGTVLGNH